MHWWRGGNSHPMIAHTIQLSVAPVFLLVAMGNFLNLLSTRLSRVVDRWRVLQARYPQTEGVEHDAIVAEIRTADRRLMLVSRAIRLLVLAGLCIGMTVATLFVEEMLNYPLERVAAGMFLIAVALLMGGLTTFLVETRVASASLRIPIDYLERHREL
jgi:hypothetical protein